MQQQTHSAWFQSSEAMPLALLAQPTASTLADASRIHEPQAAISLTALFGRSKHLPGGAAQCAIRLKHKVAPRKAALFEGQGHLRRSIARGRSRMLFR